MKVTLPLEVLRISTVVDLPLLFSAHLPLEVLRISTVVDVTWGDGATSLWKC